jgi:hypothetical protein
MVTPLFRVETRAATTIYLLTEIHIQHAHLPGIQRVTPLFRVETMNTQGAELTINLNSHVNLHKNTQFTNKFPFQKTILPLRVEIT